MSGTKKIKRAATVVLGIVGAVFLWFIIQQVRSIIFNIEGGGWNAFLVINYIVGAIIVLASLAVGSSLLYSIRKDETPFNSKNVKKLKAIAVLLVVFEPYHFLATRLFNRFFPIVVGDATIVVESSLGGAILVAGLVVYCVALVFEYGISLQKQVDETL